MNYFSVYITSKDNAEAIKIGEKLVELRLAACVTIIESVQSIYRWKDEIKNDREAVIIAKTKKSAISKLIETVKSIHSYQNPCIVVWPIVNGSTEYFEWIKREVL